MATVTTTSGIPTIPNSKKPNPVPVNQQCPEHHHRGQHARGGGAGDPRHHLPEPRGDAGGLEAFADDEERGDEDDDGGAEP